LGIEFGRGFPSFLDPGLESFSRRQSASNPAPPKFRQRVIGRSKNCNNARGEDRVIKYQLRHPWAASAMSFAIEVSGEANPLNPQQIFHVLQSASSSQQLSIQTGTQQLQTWETQKGYYTLLQVCCAPMGFWAHSG
jgi:hypothetical protein